MQDTGYLRSQAELCLRMAYEIGDDKLAAQFRAAATQYILRAAEPEPLRGDMCAKRLANLYRSDQSGTSDPSKV
jgi:hypothetical protein